MYVQWRDDTNHELGYFLMEENGKEIHQAHIKPAQREKARKQKKSIESVILEEYAEKLGKAPSASRSKEVRVVRVEHDPHNHDDRYLMGMLEHDHEYAKPHTGHDHSHDEFAKIDRHIEEARYEGLQLIQQQAEALLKHKHDDKADRDHEHPTVSLAIGALDARVAAQEGHQHDVTPAHVHELVEAEIRALKQENADLSSRVTQLMAEIRQVITVTADALRNEMQTLKNAPHTHDQYMPTAKWEEHQETISKRKTFRVVSTKKNEAGEKVTEMVEVD